MMVEGLYRQSYMHGQIDIRAIEQLTVAKSIVKSKDKRAVICNQ